MISADTVLSLLVLVCLAMLLGAYALWRRQRGGRQAALMLVLAAVVAVNIAIWVVPGSGGKALVAARPE